MTLTIVIMAFDSDSWQICSFFYDGASDQDVARRYDHERVGQGYVNNLPRDSELSFRIIQTIERMDTTFRRK